MEPGPSPLRRRCLSAVSDSLLDPVFHLFSYPRHPASSEPYPGRELAGGFESRDVSETVWDTVNRFEFLLRYQLPCHRKSLVKGTLQRPVSQLTGREEHTPVWTTAQRAHRCTCNTSRDIFAASMARRMALPMLDRFADLLRAGETGEKCGETFYLGIETDPREKCE